MNSSLKNIFDDVELAIVPAKTQKPVQEGAVLEEPWTAMSPDGALATYFRRLWAKKFGQKI